MNSGNNNNIDTPIFDEQKQFTLLEMFLILFKYKSLIFISTGIFCIVSIILYFFVYDLIYTSTASIKSSTKSSGLLGSLDVGLPDIGGLDDIGVGGGKSAKELASYEQILNSRRCLEEVVKKFNLQKRDEHKFMEDAVKNFRDEKLIIKQEKLAGMLSISVFDKDPVLAKEIVEFLLQELDKINIELNITNAKSNREFIEKRYEQAKQDLTKAEDTLKAFQMIYGVSPDLQIKAAATSLFSLEAELKIEEVKLDVLKKVLSQDQPEVKTQEAKINSLKNKISEIRNSTDLNDLLRLGNSPQIAMSYLRLTRNMEIQNKILTFILPIYEQAKIEEKRETPTILVLDVPVVAERKSKPKRLTMVIVWTFVGFVFSFAGFLTYHKGKEFINILKTKK